MKQFYTLLLLLCAAFISQAQIPMPPAPVPGNSNNCTTNSNIDVCPPNSNIVVGSHVGGTYNRGNNSNNLGVNAVWRFRNMASVGGVTINCEITVDAISNATLVALDDDAAVDQAGVSISRFFAPRISPDQNLNGSNRRGYVQFTMRFYRNPSGTNNNSNTDFSQAVSLSNLNYVHYDIDGGDAGNVNSGTAGSWFRETGTAIKVSPANPVVVANSVTELAAYDYTDAGSNWTGFAGSVYERDGVSRCAQTTASFSYAGAQPSITVRMGYDYNAGGNMGRPTRQYGSRLGCFNFPSLSTLPVNLVNFSAIFNNNQAQLKWIADNEVSFDKYVIERSNTGSGDFTAVGERKYAGRTGRNEYDYMDDLSGATASTYFYRLKMVDIDGTYTYSPIVMVKKEASVLNGIAVSPNPIVKGATSVRFTALKPGAVDLKVMDITGKMILQQKSKAFHGSNTVPVMNLDKLQPGTYILHLSSEGESSSIKFSVTH